MNESSICSLDFWETAYENGPLINRPRRERRNVPCINLSALLFIF